MLTSQSSLSHIFIQLPSKIFLLIHIVVIWNLWTFLLSLLSSYIVSHMALLLLSQDSLLLFSLLVILLDSTEAPSFVKPS